MNTADLIGTAVTNTFRSKARSILTILAIFVGAFTLTLTSGLGTGINAYIDDTVSGVGASDAMTVTKAQEGNDPLAGSSGPVEYDPDAIAGAGIPGATVIALTPDDIDTITGIDGVLEVHATHAISLDFIQVADGTKYVAGVGSLVPGQTTLLAAGTGPDADTSDPQVAIPDS